MRRRNGWEYGPYAAAGLAYAEAGVCRHFARNGWECTASWVPPYIGQLTFAWTHTFGDERHAKGSLYP
jgi:hypothetical protein